MSLSIHDISLRRVPRRPPLNTYASRGPPQQGAHLYGLLLQPGDAPAVPHVPPAAAFTSSDTSTASDCDAVIAWKLRTL